MKALQAAVIGLATILGAACSDVGTMPTELSKAATRPEVSTDGPNQALSTTQSPPSTVPDEYQHYTWIDVRVDAGWYDAHTAYGQTIVNFGGNNATASVDLTVRSAAGAVLGSNHGESQASYVFPGDRALVASTNVYVTPTCGSIAQATGSGSVWDSFLFPNQSFATWGKQSGSGTKSAAQPVCTATPPSTYPTGGDGSTPITTTPVYYDPTAPQGPTGYWECTEWYLGTDYQTSNCVWIYWYGSRTGATRPTLSRAASAVQSPSLQGEQPSVFVVVSDQVPAGALAVIERHRVGSMKNVLLVPSGTIRPAVLVAVLRALAESRARDGETPAANLRLVLGGTVQDDQIPTAARTYAATFAQLIASARRADAGPYGLRPVLEIRLGA